MDVRNVGIRRSGLECRASARDRTRVTGAASAPEHVPDPCEGPTIPLYASDGVTVVGIKTSGAEFQYAAPDTVVPEGADVAAVLDWTRRVTRLPGEQVDDVWLFRLTSG